MPKDKSYSLGYIADLTNSNIVGNKDFIVDNLSTLENASNSSITFLANTKYRKHLKNSKSLAIITNQENLVIFIILLKVFSLIFFWIDLIFIHVFF